MNFSIVSPVIIPTLNRYEHFKRCVESLSRCTLADRTELIIGLDYPPSEEYEEGYKKICSYISQIQGFLKVTVLRHEHNMGAIGNTEYLKDYVKKRFDRYIFTEDDNEFSPCFLDFMNKGLEIYKNSPQITTICGFNQYYVENEKIIFTYDNSAWGLGLWRDKYSPTIQDSKITTSSLKTICKLFYFYPMVLSAIINSLKKNEIYGDTNRTVYNIVNDKFQIRPSLSLVRNWGHDGSGEHCGMMEKFVKMEIAKEMLFDFPKLEPHRTKSVDRMVMNNMMPNSFIKLLMVRMKILVQAISYWISYEL